MIKTLFSYFRPHIRIFALDMFCAIMVAAVDLAFPLVSRKAMYDLLPEIAVQAYTKIRAEYNNRNGAAGQ